MTLGATGVSRTYTRPRDVHWTEGGEKRVNRGCMRAAGRVKSGMSLPEDERNALDDDDDDDYNNRDFREGTRRGGYGFCPSFTNFVPVPDVPLLKSIIHKTID